MERIAFECVAFVECDKNMTKTDISNSLRQFETHLKRQRFEFFGLWLRISSIRKIRRKLEQETPTIEDLAWRQKEPWVDPVAE